MWKPYALNFLGFLNLGLPLLVRIEENSRVHVSAISCTSLRYHNCFWRSSVHFNIGGVGSLSPSLSLSLSVHVYESWQNSRGHAQATHRPVRAHMRERDICTAHHTLHLARSSYVNGRVETHRCSQRLIAHNMILNTFKIYGKYVYTQTYVILYIHNVHDIYTIHTLLCHKVWFHSCVYILPQAHRPCSDILHTWGFPTTVDPQVTKGFNTKRANLDHLGAPPILGNLHII